MKFKEILFSKIFIALFLVGSVLFSSCNKTELEDLRAENAELQAQLNSSIEDLEAQKAALESQKLEADADIAGLNDMIAKLEGMIASRYVERYLVTIIGREDHREYKWEHLYNEEMQLAISNYIEISQYSFDYWDLTQGETSKSVIGEVIHDYTDGILTSSTYDKTTLYWEVTNGSITKITEVDAVYNDLTQVFTIDPSSGNITSSFYYYGEEKGHGYYYTYNERGLLTNVKYYSGNTMDGERVYEYDNQNRMVSYKLYDDGELEDEYLWNYNADGKLTEYYSNDYNSDTVILTYNTDGSWEVNAKGYDNNDILYRTNIRIYDIDGNETYYYHQYNDDLPSERASEYTNGFLTRKTQFRYLENIEGEPYVSFKEIITYGRDENGLLYSVEYENTNYNENGTINNGELYANVNIEWFEDEKYWKSYTSESYDFETKVLTERGEHTYERTESGNRYELSFKKYYVSGGVAQYISYEREITEFYEAAPNAGKTKVYKYYNDLGETTETYTYVNEVNSEDPYDWYWELVAN